MVSAHTSSQFELEFTPGADLAPWEKRQLGELVRFEGGSQPPRSTFIYEERAGTIRLIQIRDYKSDEWKTFIPVNLARKKCTSDDIMIGRYGPPIFQILRGLTGAYNVALIKAIPTDELLRPYLYHFLKQPALLRFVESLSQRTSGQTGIEMDALKEYPFPLPPTKFEQNRIATALDDTDALILSLEKLIEKKRNIKQGAMQELLTGRRRLPGFGGSTVSGTLGELFVARPKRKQVSPSESVVFLGMEDISSGGGLLNQTVLPFNQVRNGLTPFERDDILVAKITPCFENGKGAFLSNLKTKVGFGSTEFHVLRATSDADPRYIYFHTQTAEFRKTLETEMIGTAGQKRVPIAAIEKYPLVVKHSFLEQQAISKILSEMDLEIDGLQKRLIKMRGLKQGMMQNLLTGKIRLV
jgi:type I restriction enzyme S subunit